MKIFKVLESLALSDISLENFYGIELDDFAHEVAILSLWLAEHQMNQVFFKEFGRTKPALPLKETGNIVHGNACRIDWETVCPKNLGDEIYIMGNPPYIGRSLRNYDQQIDMDFVFSGIDNYKDLDYICCWFILSSKYIHSANIKFSFVTTNSISQGIQVSLLWPHIFKLNHQINFCHTSFKWGNNAKANAGVSVVIIGISNEYYSKTKCIYNGSSFKIVDNINPYLVDSKNLIIENRFKPLSEIPEITLGNAPKDNGGLIISEFEYENFLKEQPKIGKYIKKYIGADEFINSYDRFCFWIKDSELNSAIEFPEIKRRLEIVKQFRLTSKKIPTQKLAQYPHRFGEIRYFESNSIIVPSVTSERRDFLPIGFLDKNCIISNSAFAVYDSSLWVFALLSSTMQMLWLKSVAGRLESRLRYSSQLVYNTFPFPNISEAQKQELEQHVYHVLAEREKHSEKTLAQLYDPDKMPDGLREAHHQLDLAVERCYRTKPFESDEERLEYLFKLYEKMIEEEKSKGTLFENEKKSKKKKQ
jgi:hypothetical protein